MAKNKPSDSYEVNSNGHSEVTPNGISSCDQLTVVDDVRMAEDDVRCGYGQCKPDTLQKCNNPKILLAVMCVLAISQGKMIMPAIIFKHYIF